MKLSGTVTVAATVIALAVFGMFAGLQLGDTDSSDADTGGQYQVHMDFNETVTSADMAEAQDLIRAFDADVELMIMESFPPQGSAVVETADVGFCTAIVAELEAKSYVNSASCETWTPAGDGGDEPVFTNNAG